VQFSTETSQSWRSNVVDTAKGLAKPGGAGAQNKIIFALKLRESASLKDAVSYGAPKNKYSFFVFHHQLFQWASVTSNNSGVIASA